MSKIYSASSDAEVLFFPYDVEKTYDSSGLGLPLVSPFGDSLLDCTRLSSRADIIEVSTSKPKSGVGSFSVTLSSRVNYKKLLQPGCWCLIYISDQRTLGKDLEDKDYATTEDSGFKMLGIVRTVRRQESLDFSTGVKTIRFMVAGEDFQSIFNTPIYVNKNLTALGNQGGDARRVGLATLKMSELNGVKSPSDMVEILIKNLIGTPGYKGDTSRKVKPLGGAKTGIPIQMPKEVSKILLGSSPSDTEFASALTLLIQEDLIGTGLFQADLGGVVPAWSIIQTYVHRLLNELYTEILPISVGGGFSLGGSERLAPCIVMRAIPFSIASFIPGNPSRIKFLDGVGDDGARKIAARLGKDNNKITTPKIPGFQPSDAHFYVSADIEEAEILAFDMGKSDKERFNFFFIPPALNDPMKVDSAVEANMLRMLYSFKIDNLADTASIARYGLRPFVAQSNYQLMGKAKAMADTVKDLWINAHLFESGQVTLTGRAKHIPVGTNVQFTARNWVGHVEGVSHNFRCSSEGVKSFYTTLALSRLQTMQGDPIDGVEFPPQTRDWERGTSTNIPEDPFGKLKF